jgi:hypothetical protein
MTELKSNDHAFIKISKELHCLRNDHKALTMLQYCKVGAGQHSPDAVHSEEWKCLNRLVNILTSENKMRETLISIRERIKSLEELSDAYIRGDDIVATRLMKE